MPRLFVGNFDFEEHLAGDRQNPPEALQRINAELSPCLVSAAGDGDCIWCPEPVVTSGFWEELQRAGMPAVQPVTDMRQVPAGLELTPWGWTDEVRGWSSQVKALIHAPPQPAVRSANSRRFSFACEQEWGVALRNAAAVTAPADVPAIVDRVGVAGHRWVVKAEFSHAARERILGRGPTVDPATANWIRRRIERDGVVFLEPWVDRIGEAGLQWTVPQQGPPVLEGITPLLTDDYGRYCGSVFETDEPLERLWAHAVEIGRRLAERLQASGYFGPLGIDAMRYRDVDGRERVRPLQDVNARWTMGRLALGWKRLLQPGERGVWRHVTRRDEVSEPVPNTRRIITSPDVVGRRPVQHRTYVEAIRS